MRAAAINDPNESCYCPVVSCFSKYFGARAGKKSEYGFVTAQHIAELRKELESLNKNSPDELSYNYLSFVEQSIQEASFRYAVVYKKGKPILFVYFQLFTLRAGNFNLSGNSLFTKGIAHMLLELKRLKVLMAGNALRINSSCCCYDEDVLSVADPIKLIEAIADKVSGDEGVAGTILRSLPQFPETASVLRGIGYESPWSDKMMELHMSEGWVKMDDYIADLSRKYRTRAKKILSAGQPLDLIELNEADINRNAQAINRLFKEVAAQQFALASPSAQHFAGLKQLHGDSFEVTGYFLDKKLVAFSTAFVSEAAFELYYVGLDYSLNEDYQLYFNMLFNGVQRAIALGKQKLILGRTSFDAKASLGAKPVNIEYFIKVNGIPQIAYRWFSKYFASLEDGHWKLRNPLKSESKVAESA